MTAGIGKGRSELVERAIWGGTLAALAIGALWLGAWPFGLLLAVGAAIAAWEWARLVRPAGSDLTLQIHASAAVAAVLLATAGLAGLAVLALAAGTVALFLLRTQGRDILSVLGLPAIGGPAVGLAYLRSDAPLGLFAVLFVFVVVWMTDIGGYVFGRSIGGPRLLPSISPGKTWAGAVGGLVLAAATGAVMALALGHGHVLGLVGIALGLGLAAEIGDLAESALKRRAGVKDASALIPGHGGLLDRIDGLLSAAAAATLLATFRDPTHPAAGLVLWS